MFLSFFILVIWLPHIIPPRHLVESGVKYHNHHPHKIQKWRENCMYDIIQLYYKCIDAIEVILSEMKNNRKLKIIKNIEVVKRLGLKVILLNNNTIQMEVIALSCMWSAQDFDSAHFKAIHLSTADSFPTKIIFICFFLFVTYTIVKCCHNQEKKSPIKKYAPILGIVSFSKGRMLRGAGVDWKLGDQTFLLRRAVSGRRAL